ncbi:MAG: DUF3800 domain-containing protein [Pirellulales bacterium]
MADPGNDTNNAADSNDELTPSAAPSHHSYYVDEAGDPTLFNRKGKLIVGTPGCSRFFILGKLDVQSPDELAGALYDLRQRLLADPYFAGVPSMSTDRRKTAKMFHAKDDVAEVRRDVFRLLLDFDVRFYAVVRDKRVIAEKVLEFNRKRPAYRYHPNQLYDRCVPTLFEDRLHKGEAYRIIFAKRGSSDRTDAFEHGLREAKAKFQRKWGIESAAPIEVVASDPSQIHCLQAIDYFLWATQRCFERGEHRYLDLMWDKVGLIIDKDDTRQRRSGEYYPRRRRIVEGFRNEYDAD